MAIQSCAEMAEKRSAAVDRAWNRTYSRTFRVITDDKYDGARLVSRAPGIALGNIYDTTNPHTSVNEQDLQSFCMGIKVQCAHVDGCTWEVTFEYGPYDPTIHPENPLDQPAEIAWTFAPFESIADEDVNGDAIVNSAGDYFDPPVMKDDSQPVLTITRNEPTFDPLLAAECRDKTNDAPFLGSAPGTVKVMDISGDRQWNAQCQWYWKVRYEFKFDKKTWTRTLLDQGVMELDPGGTHQQVIQNSGVPSASPSLLDGSGHVLAHGSPPVYLDFDIYEPIDFGQFNIDQPTDMGGP
jgi:hypothetical protein